MSKNLRTAQVKARSARRALESLLPLVVQFPGPLLEPRCDERFAAGVEYAVIRISRQIAQRIQELEPKS